MGKIDLTNPEFKESNYIQIYTGDGKGKTTASLGLTLRALGRGWKVLFIFFTKGGSNYGEVYTFQQMSNDIKKRLDIIAAGTDKVLYKANITNEDRDFITDGWQKAKQAILTGSHNLVVMDEINICIELDLIPLREVKRVLYEKHPNAEVVLTGRHAHPELIKIAHLVSEIHPVKHYYDIGVMAREGIER